MKEFGEYIENNVNERELNKFQKNKLNWLYDTDYSYNSKLNFWKLFNNNVTFIEEEKGKDVYDFDKSEIIDLIKNTPSLKVSTKLTLFSMISRYIDWTVNRGFNYIGNPCDTINIHKILDIDVEVTKEQYQSLHKFYSWLHGMKNAVSPIDIAMLVFMRYGVNTKDMGNIKPNDIDRENLLLNTTNKGIPVSIPIDTMFIEYMDKAIDCYEFDNIKYEYSDYILKPQQNMKSDIVTDVMIFNKYNVILKKSQQKRLSISQLNLNRKYDLLYNKFMLNDEITVEDIKEVLYIFNGKKPTPNQALTLRRNIETTFTEIKVNTGRTRKNS